MKSFGKLFVFLSFSFFINSKAIAQDSTTVTQATDSGYFSINDSSGWQLLNSYVHSTEKDSLQGVQLELILQHPNNIDWTQEQYVGKVTPSAFAPALDQSLIFNIMDNSYQLRIDSTGSCYLNFINGALPSADTVILFPKVFYKL